MTIEDIIEDTENAYDEFRAKYESIVNYVEVCEAFNELLNLLGEA